MRIGLISDIHSNIQALDAVLEELARLGVERTLCIGDLMCYGADPGAVIARLQSRNIPAVMGNYDEAVALNLPSASRRPSSPRNEPLKRAALAWTQETVTDAERRYLAHLPWVATFSFSGERVHLVHAGLDYLDEWVAPDSPETLHKIARRFPGDIVALGHTHLQFAETVDNTLLVNPGAVGRSLDGDPRASFAVLDCKTRQVTFFRTDYAIDAAIAAIEASSMPNEISRLVRHGARRIEELEA